MVQFLSLVLSEIPVWFGQKKIQKNFSEFALPQFWQVRLMSPFPSRVFISDQIQELSGFSGNIVGHDIGAFLYLYVKSGEHNNTNFIRCRGFESKDLKKTMEPAKILIFRSKIDEKFEFHSSLNLVENWTRMQLTTFHNTNSINQI